MGEDANDILTSTNIITEERKWYQSVIVKLDGFFQVWRNVIFEWVRFNHCVQKKGESVVQFITNLYNLVETFNYGDLKDKMIRDRIVIGSRNNGRSECPQTLADLTLEKAKTLVRQQEVAHEHQLTLNGPSKAKKSVQEKAVTLNSKGHGHFPKTAQSAFKSSTNKGSRCCHRPHHRHQCTGRDSECHKCHKTGHKSVGVICDPPPQLDDFTFLKTWSAGRACHS